MALRVVGWVQQVSSDQFMAIRVAALGGATSFHAKFGEAQGAVESVVGHKCQARKSGTAVPSRWEMVDDDGT